MQVPASAIQVSTVCSARLASPGYLPPPQVSKHTSKRDSRSPVPSLVPGPDMSKDPNGFYGVTWGARPSDVLDLIQVTSREHVQEYELKQGPPQLGEVTVDSVRLFTFDGQFARVAIHYRGEQTHRRVLAHN